MYVKWFGDTLKRKKRTGERCYVPFFFYFRDEADTKQAFFNCCLWRHRVVSPDVVWSKFRAHRLSIRVIRHQVFFPRPFFLFFFFFLVKERKKKKKGRGGEEKRLNDCKACRASGRYSLLPWEYHARETKESLEEGRKPTNQPNQRKKEKKKFFFLFYFWLFFLVVVFCFLGPCFFKKKKVRPS